MTTPPKPRSAVRAWLFAGTAVLTLAAACAASAQTPAAPEAEAPRPELGVLGEEGTYLEANELTENDETGVVTARGQVEARNEGRTVRADEVTYERRTGRVLARGNVRVINPDGTVAFADEVELDEQFRAGVAVGFSTRLAQNVKIAAATAIRRSEDVQELTNAIYTPCNVCVEDGVVTTPPTFSLQAERVVQDRRRRVIVYRNAVLRVRNVPVLYLPVFAHPDPTAERASGLLIPRVEISDRRGVSYEQPYLWVIDPHSDLVISPQFNTSVRPLLNLDYRRRFYSGDMQLRAGYTYEQDFDNDGDRFGDETSRSYILGRGDFDFNERWSWGFAAERVSDDTLFDRYGTDDVFERRGLYQADSRRLLSQIYTQRQDARSYLSVAALSFQGLRPGDNDRTFPNVAPLVEGRWEPRTEVLGGRLRLSGGGVLLERSQGADSARGTAEVDWRRQITLPSGVRIEPFAYARGDLYNVSEFSTTGDDGGAVRGAASLGADISMPFARVAGPVTFILEPLAQLSANVETDIDDEVPNEDSLVFDLDETNIFRPNRFPGYDRYENGLVATAGGRASARWQDGRSASIFLGRTFRSRTEDGFPDRAGLRGRASDWVVQAEATPIANVNGFVRARLDDDDLSVNRAEAGVNWYSTRTAGSVRYLYDDTDLTGVTRHDVQFSGELFLTERFGLVAIAINDLEDGELRYGEFGVVYRDECVRLEILYERDNTQNRALGPSSSVNVRLTLATLGGVGYRDYDTR